MTEYFWALALALGAFALTQNVLTIRSQRRTIGILQERVNMVTAALDEARAATRELMTKNARCPECPLNQPDHPVDYEAASRYALEQAMSETPQCSPEFGHWFPWGKLTCACGAWTRDHAEDGDGLAVH